MSSRSPLSSRFGSRVREIREQRKQRLEDVIDAGAGGSNGRLSRLERGQVSPTLRTVEELADVLEVEPLDLFIDPKAGLRHDVVGATRGANHAQLAHALAVLRRTEPEVPNREELRARIATLPGWASATVRDVLSALEQPHDPRGARGLGLGLTDLRPSELVMIDGIVTAIEQFTGFKRRATDVSATDEGQPSSASSKRRPTRTEKKKR